MMKTPVISTVPETRCKISANNRGGHDMEQRTAGMDISRPAPIAN